MSELFSGPTGWNPDPVWSAGPRIRIGDMRRGQRFIAVDGSENRVDHNHGGCVYTRRPGGGEGMFAACASGVLVPSESEAA